MPIFGSGTQTSKMKNFKELQQKGYYTKFDEEFLVMKCVIKNPNNYQCNKNHTTLNTLLSIYIHHDKDIRSDKYVFMWDKDNKLTFAENDGITFNDENNIMIVRDNISKN